MSPDNFLLAQARISEQSGALDIATEIYRALLADHPEDVGLLLHIGHFLTRSRRHDAARTVFRLATILQPDQEDAHLLLGHAFQDLNRGHDAILAYSRAMLLAPSDAEPAFHLGIVLQALRGPATAAEAYRRALVIDPQSAKSFANLGVCALSRGCFDEAITFYRRTLRLDPTPPLTWSNLGNALGRLGQNEHALTALKTALTLDPSHPDILYNMGNAFSRLDRHDAATEAFRRATWISPPFARAHDNLGVSLHNLGHLEEALAAHRQAIALSPDNAEAHFNLAHSLLLAGHYEQGFEEFEWRWQLDNFPSPKRNFPQPLWDGTPFSDKTLLVHAEQGMGDTIQFCRYIPKITSEGGHVILECPSALSPLLRNLAEVEEVIETGHPLPTFDIHVPIYSLPKIFRTTPATIPGQIPYLYSRSERAACWRSRIGETSNLKVGLVWAGNPGHGNDRNRSIPWPILQSAEWPQGMTYFSFQKGRTRTGMRFGNDTPVIDLADEINDFADFAAAVSAMDLMICVDTAAAHLTGALGQTVWTLLPFAPDWRWGRENATTAWYPTMRLFRQDTQSDWKGVLSRVTRALATMTDRQILHAPPRQTRQSKSAQSLRKP
jgi:tetratricopeptide (TPR) repeat protein